MHLSAEMALQNRPGGRGLALVAIFTKKPGHCPFRSARQFLANLYDLQQLQMVSIFVVIT